MPDAVSVVEKPKHTSGEEGFIANDNCGLTLTVNIADAEQAFASVPVMV